MDFDRCDAHWSDLDNSDAGCRAHRQTEALFEAVKKKSLWDDYGIISDILVCHSSYPNLRPQLSPQAFHAWISACGYP